MNLEEAQKTKMVEDMRKKDAIWDKKRGVSNAMVSTLVLYPFRDQRGLMQQRWQSLHYTSMDELPSEILELVEGQTDLQWPYRRPIQPDTSLVDFIVSTIFTGKQLMTVDTCVTREKD